MTCDRMDSRLCNTTDTGLHHGGRLRDAARQFGIAVDHWIDLSTGISPWSWPVPPLPEAVWRRLPEDDDELLATAADYYRCRPAQLLATPGSQWAISTLPSLPPPAAIALPFWGYSEHSHHWLRSGHRPFFYRCQSELEQLVRDGTVSHAVVINPNNPTGDLIAPAALTALASALAQRPEPGFLVVDEAFMDTTPQHSVMTTASSEVPPGLVILRSLGKFFGLAGARVGFVLAGEAIVAALQRRLDPWAVSHPARWVAAAALADGDWQQRQQRRLAGNGGRWADLLRQRLDQLARSPWQITHTPLFTSLRGTRPQCEQLYRHCAREGLLVRLIAGTPPGMQTGSAAGPEDGPRDGIVRIGLPLPAEQDEVLARLTAALAAVAHPNSEDGQ